MVPAAGTLGMSTKAEKAAAAIPVATAPVGPEPRSTVRSPGTTAT
jgi:hypothetical protein